MKDLDIAIPIYKRHTAGCVIFKNPSDTSEVLVVERTFHDGITTLSLPKGKGSRIL